MVPAPTLTPSPTVASPTYERCGTFDPRPIVDFLSSTKLPTFALGPTCESGRRWQKGPRFASSSIADSRTTQYGKRVTRAAMRDELTWQPTPMTHSPPIVDCPSMTTWG